MFDQLQELLTEVEALKKERRSLIESRKALIDRLAVVESKLAHGGWTAEDVVRYQKAMDDWRNKAAELDAKLTSLIPGAVKIQNERDAAQGKLKTIQDDLERVIQILQLFEVDENLSLSGPIETLTKLMELANAQS